jgi:LmbE family N-acetylglucosaminyl deacetylase
MTAGNPKTLMLVGAHHDDNELNAGTIQKHTGAGWRVISVVVTNGRYSQDGVSDENIEIRNQESLAAAELLGMDAVFLGFDEGCFRESEDTTRAVVVEIRKHEPDVIITHPPHDYHNDHMQVSRCVLNAVYLCGNTAYDGGEAPIRKNPGLYYCDAWLVPFEPDVYVDVSDCMEMKEKALACHTSQLPPQGSSEDNMIDLEQIRARARGLQAGCTYAEAFRFVPRAGKVRMAGLLG